MEIQQFACFKATVNYHRTDDLKDNVAPDKANVLVQALWIAEDDENFNGDWIFDVAEYKYNLPQRDLVLLEKIDINIFHKKTFEKYKYKK